MKRTLVADHEPPARAPLTVVPGERVQVGDRDEQWPAFVFVTSVGGCGWVPSRHLEMAGGVGTVVVGYDTTELAATRGEVVDVIRDDPESGWSWCANEHGRCGWIPHRVLGE